MTALRKWATKVVGLCLLLLRGDCDDNARDYDRIVYNNLVSSCVFQDLRDDTSTDCVATIQLGTSRIDIQLTGLATFTQREAGTCLGCNIMH